MKYIQTPKGLVGFPDDMDDNAIGTALSAHFNPPREISPFMAGAIGMTADAMTLGARVAEAANAPETAKEWLQGAESRRKTVEEGYKPKVRSYTDIPNILDDPIGFARDTGQYVYEQGAQSLPYIAAPAVGALAGAAAAPALGVGALAAGTAGAIATGTIPFAGSNIERQMKEGTKFEETNLPAALGTAVIQSGLDAAIGKFLPGLSKAATGPLIARLAKKVPGAAGTEALTETAQQALEILQANPDKLWEMPKEVQAELVESAVAGGLLGGIVGGAAAIPRPKPEADTPGVSPPKIDPDLDPESHIGRVMGGRQRLALPPPALVTPPPVTPENVFTPRPYPRPAEEMAPPPQSPETPAGEEGAPKPKKDAPVDQRVYRAVFDGLLAAGIRGPEAVANAKMAAARYEALAALKNRQEGEGFTDAWEEYKSSNLSYTHSKDTTPIGSNRMLNAEVMGHRSVLQQKLANPTMKRGTAQQWLNYLKKQGVKDEELEWTDTKDWLEEADPKQVFAVDDIRRMPMYYGVNKIAAPAGQLSDGVDYSKYTLGNFGTNPKSNYRDVVLSAGGAGAWNKGDDYRSAHFSKVSKPLLHYRTTDRVTPDGKKVLLAEEIQSDWHQAGQKRGYRGSPKEMELANDRVNRLSGPAASVLRANDLLGFDTLGQVLRAIKAEGTGPWEFNSSEDRAVVDDYLAAVREVNRHQQGVADAPFKQSWPNLALRHAIIDAIENDQDYVAWTTGEQNTDRYWTKDNPDYGSKLKGMQEFYDKRLVNYANKLGKQFGAQVGKININDGGEPRITLNDYLETGQVLRSPVEVHALPITPQLRKWAESNPFALFNKTGGKRVRAGAALFHPPSQGARRKIVMALTKYRTPGTIMHEFAHIWFEEMRRDAAKFKEVAQDLKTILDWLGLDNPRKIERHHHEKLALAMEKYLAEGKAPTSALKEVFERFKQWMISAIRDVMRDKDAQYKFPQEIKDVLGRLLGGPSIPVDPETKLAPSPTGRGPLSGGHFGTSALGSTTKLENTITNRLANSAAGRKWQKLTNPLGVLPQQDDYKILRMLTQGKADRIDNFAKDLSSKIKTKDPKVMQEVYNFLTTRGANPSMISDPALRTPAKNIKDTVNNISRELVRAGKLSVTSAANFHDQYLPRLYLKFLIEKKGMKASGIKVGDEGYLKQRKNLTADERKALGEVKDPSYLAYVALTRPMRDLAIADMMDALTKNPDWVWQASLVNYNGKMVTPYWLKAEASDIRERALLEPNPQTKQDMERIATQMETAAAQNNPANNDYDHNDFTRMPDTKSYGPMRGAVVRKEIADDVKGMEQFTDPNNFMEKWFGDRGSHLVKANQLWKEIKVVWNVPTQVRNFVSNLGLLWLSGVPLHKTFNPAFIGRAAKEILSNGKYYQIAKKYGMMSSTMTESELRTHTDEFLKELNLNNQGAIKGSLLPVMKAFGKMRELAQSSYQNAEMLGKIMKIMDAMEREKLSEADAALAANEALFDYSLVSPSVRYLRNAPLGMPFITFTTKVLPLLVKYAGTPRGIIRYAGMIGMAQALPALVASMNDIDEEDVEKLRLSLSERLRKRGDLYLLPYKDANNRWQFVDVGYFLPWQQFADAGRAMLRGELFDAAKALGALSGPTPNLIAAVTTGIDSFTGKPIMDKRDPWNVQAWSLTNFVWGQIAPSAITQYGALGHAMEAYSNSGSNRYGEPNATPEQIIARSLGVNVSPVNPELQRARNLMSMQYEIDQVKTRMNSALRDQSLTPSQRASTINSYQAEIRRRYEKMSKYIKDSEPSPKLRAATERRD